MPLKSLGSARKISAFVGCSAVPSPKPFTVTFFQTTPRCRVFSSSELACLSRPNIRDISFSIWAQSPPFVFVCVWFRLVGLAHGGGCECDRGIWIVGQDVRSGCCRNSISRHGSKGNENPGESERICTVYQLCVNVLLTRIGGVLSHAFIKPPRKIGT